MSNQWRVGDAIMQQARTMDDYRGVQLHGAHAQAQQDQIGANKVAKGAIGVGGVAIGAMAVVGTLAVAGAVAPLAAGIALAGATVFAMGSVATAGLFKAVSMIAGHKAQKLSKPIQMLERGEAINSVISFLGGDKIASRLGGWRHDKNAALQAERGLSADQGVENKVRIKGPSQS